MDDSIIFYSVSDKTVAIADRYGLTNTEMHTYALIDSLSRTGLCRISQVRMARVLRVSRKAVNEAINRLTALHLVIKLPEYVHGYVTEYTYQAVIHCM